MNFKELTEKVEQNIKLENQIHWRLCDLRRTQTILYFEGLIGKEVVRELNLIFRTIPVDYSYPKMETSVTIPLGRGNSNLVFSNSTSFDQEWSYELESNEPDLKSGYPGIKLDTNTLVRLIVDCQKLVSDYWENEDYHRRY